MSSLKKISLILLIVFIAIQFIQPARNTNGEVMKADITKQFSVPADVQNILKKSCYDCHSNNTRYPWYANIQPMGWLLASHIKKGKAELNFDEFGSYTKRTQSSKLKSIANSVKDKSMPLASYTLMHEDAKLDDRNRQRIVDWALTSKDSLEAQQKR
jgi:hypothetical protein